VKDNHCTTRWLNWTGVQRTTAGRNSRHDAGSALDVTTARTLAPLNRSATTRSSCFLKLFRGLPLAAGNNRYHQQNQIMNPRLKLLTLILTSLSVAGWLGAAPVLSDVGEAESFGHAALFMGATTGDISLAPVCGPMPAPVPPQNANNNQCFAVNAPPLATSFSAPDLCRIMLPKKATRTIIYPALNFFISYELKNNTGVFQNRGQFQFLANVSIESDVLQGIVDPRTEQPANGKLDGLFTDSYNLDRSMQTLDREKQRLMLTRVGNAGITKSSLVGLGFPQTVVDDLFNSPMTIRKSVTGNVQLLNDETTTPATITANMRLFGD
jgi:hypothetical protein